MSALIRASGIALFVAVACSACMSAEERARRPIPGMLISFDAIAKSQVRVLEELQLAFDRRKTRFYGPIEAHLARSPTAYGKLVLSITIEPTGKISDCHLVSSTVADPVLEAAIVSEAGRLDVGARDVPTATFPSYPIYIRRQ